MSYPNMGLSELLCENGVVNFKIKSLVPSRCSATAFRREHPSCEKRTGASIKIMAIDIQQEEKIEGQKKPSFQKETSILLIVQTNIDCFSGKGGS